jgi:hypothetical protein
MCAVQRTPRVGAQCYERAVKKWLVIGVLLAIGAVVAIVMLTRSSPGTPAAPQLDPVVEDFRAVERQCIAAFNQALARQRENKIDELELAGAIEGTVLEPWRAMRARVAAAPVPPARRELYTVMRRYIDERDAAWQAYVLALHAKSDAEARPRYDAYHQKNAQAQDDARVLGGMFRGQ